MNYRIKNYDYIIRKHKGKIIIQYRTIKTFLKLPQTPFSHFSTHPTPSNLVQLNDLNPKLTLQSNVLLKYAINQQEATQPISKKSQFSAQCRIPLFPTFAKYMYIYISARPYNPVPRYASKEHHEPSRGDVGVSPFVGAPFQINSNPAR